MGVGDGGGGGDGGVGEGGGGGGDAGGEGGWGHGGDDSGEGGGGREATTATTAKCMGRCAPIPLAAPNTHGGIEGGYATHDKSARDGIRGFEGSRVRGFGVRFPGLTPKGSSALRVW